MNAEVSAHTELHELKSREGWTISDKYLLYLVSKVAR